ncbi:hypothetical protein GCM10011391_15300 [Pullulanibacillus camelliae]|uniref:HTH luxR-type domain-containing protein n=1 Tax=Pullulanibacillus camelliae TaxID=1707096 RepID=A0A8J2VM00_9BACL|nr:RNA polymerase sigma factor [Pullulanibacillus camelliae]GGE37355.1 hypothetical protein GCM10011391_15300 [Pullulanibacillus camelliae]
MSQSLKAVRSDGFVDLIQQHMAALRQYCIRLTQSQWEGEDLVQETLLRAYKSWNERPREITKAFLFRIASNFWIDQHRKQQPNMVINEALVHQKATSQDKHDKTCLDEALQRLLKTLTLKQRTIFVLIEGFGLTSKAVAERLELSEGAVKAALHRARKKLKTYDPNALFSEDEETMPYIQAITTGQLQKVIALYHNPVNLKMTHPQSTLKVAPLHAIRRTGAYMVLTWLGLKGELWMVPFYKNHLTVLLTFLDNDNLDNLEQSCVA